MHSQHFNSYLTNSVGHTLYLHPIKALVLQLHSPRILLLYNPNPSSTNSNICCTFDVVHWGWWGERGSKGRGRFYRVAPGSKKCKMLLIFAPLPSQGCFHRSSNIIYSVGILRMSVFETNLLQKVCQYNFKE